MRYLRSITWALLSLVLFGPLLAATEYEVCTELVKTALEATDDVCVNTGRNSACYGHVQLEAEPQVGFESFKFDEVGDTVGVAHLNTLRLSPMDLQAGTWGVALLRLQADIPDDKPQNVNLLLFGDVVVENLAPDPVLMDVIMNSSGNVNIRRKPESSAFVMGTLMEGQTVTARGRSEDNEWIYVALPETDDQRGWVLRSLVDSEANLDDLNIVQPNLTQYGPMQAFYLKTGSNSSTCAEAPSDGLLVQTPEGIAEVRLWINEVKIRLGSTAFIQSSPGNQMTINTLEGAAHVEALGVEQVAVAGTGVTIQLDQNSNASAPPSAPKQYTADAIHNVPVENLDRPLTQVEGSATDEPILFTDEPSTVIPATPTPKPTNTAIVTQEPSAEPSATATEEPAPTKTNTQVPPTATDVPPTAIPPTDPPTDEPPTDAPPATEEPTVESSGSDTRDANGDVPTEPPASTEGSSSQSNASTSPPPDETEAA
jgi:hypothetical protein